MHSVHRHLLGKTCFPTTTASMQRQARYQRHQRSASKHCRGLLLQYGRSRHFPPPAAGCCEGSRCAGLTASHASALTPTTSNLGRISVTSSRGLNHGLLFYCRDAVAIRPISAGSSSVAPPMGPSSTPPRSNCYRPVPLTALLTSKCQSRNSALKGHLTTRWHPPTP